MNELVRLTRRAFTLGTACMLAAAPLAGAAGENLSPEDMRRDLAAAWDALLNVTIDPFRTSNRSAVAGLYEAVRASLTQSMSREKFWMRAAPVFGALNDGHVLTTFLRPADYYEKVGGRFPFDIAFVDDEMVVSNDGGRLPRWTRIVSVDGYSAGELRAAALEVTGAETVALHAVRAGEFFPQTLLALEDGPRSRYNIRFVDAGGIERSQELSPATSGSSSPVALPPYEYREIADGTIGVLNYRRCEDLARFEEFIAAAVSRMQKPRVRAVIVDIRENEGGDSRLNDRLWQRLAGRPFKQFGTIAFRSSDLLKRELGHDHYVRRYGEEAWAAADATVFTRGSSDPEADLTQPLGRSDRFSGPVYLLIGPSTFSSAMSCASAAADYGLGTLIGSETAEPVNSTGEVYSLRTLPTGLRVNLTTKYFRAPRSHPDRKGVVPNHRVLTTLHDRRRGRDPVLALAVRLALA